MIIIETQRWHNQIILMKKMIIMERYVNKLCLETIRNGIDCQILSMNKLKTIKRRGK